MQVEPVAGEPAAIADVDGSQKLIIADYHAGVEVALRNETGVEVDSHAADRRDRLLSLVEQTNPDQLIVLGDLMHSIGDPGGAERGELEVLFESLPESLDVFLAKGNHDGAIESWIPDIEITPTAGEKIGNLGIMHGHTWPSQSVLSSEIICMGHEHPVVRLEDTVGGSEIRRAWIRGTLIEDPFARRGKINNWRGPELIICPAFNELVGGTWINEGQDDFLAPFLPDGLPAGDAFLLDGTYLGDYRSI
ncbi:metallophosphoesterase [Salinarchaeum sp. IM2453]|uniref:metallophosphoesterase n=1 Tax=Salinarchaeum sp. IM2453 TaxID=2862870 RepID=UPI001C831572|nr:metallophosphoesterase [Salinarchaeum sp. IM2453]QZA88909.1 metallophosphoesterase [Salinarchaeum sp. IM2453]